jgi:hypothetical protein
MLIVQPELSAFAENFPLPSPQVKFTIGPGPCPRSMGDTHEPERQTGAVAVKLPDCVSRLPGLYPVKTIVTCTGLAEAPAGRTQSDTDDHQRREPLHHAPFRKHDTHARAEVCQGLCTAKGRAANGVVRFVDC